MTGATMRGRRAFITGGARGIGRGIVRALAAQGAAVAFNYHSDEANAAALTQEITNTGGMAMAICGDATDAAQVAAMIAATEAGLGGGIDTAIANVGPFRLGPLPATTPVEFDTIVRGNLSAAFYLAHAVVPGMRAAGGGVFVTIGLAPTSDTLDGAAHIAAYACAKAGLTSLTKSMATEYAPVGIRVAMVAPGLIGHEGLDPIQAAWMGRRVPMGRLGTPHEVADAVLFLASDRAAYCSGAVLAVCGGWDWSRDRNTSHDTPDLMHAIGPPQAPETHHV